MTCKESMRSLLALGAANPAVAEHLRECSDCQSAARAANALRLEGDVRRQEEISPRVQRDAHREAVRILEQRRQAKNPFLSPVFAWRAAAVAVPVAAGVMAVVLYLHGDGSPTAALAPSAAPAVATAPARSELEGEIQNRRDAVNEGFRQFQKRYRDTRTASAFDVRSERLRGRMETFSSSIAKELGSAEPKAGTGIVPARQGPADDGGRNEKGTERKETERHDTTWQTMGPDLVAYAVDGVGSAEGQRTGARA